MKISRYTVIKCNQHIYPFLILTRRVWGITRFCLGVRASLELEGVLLFSIASSLVSIRTTRSATEFSLELISQSTAIESDSNSFPLSFVSFALTEEHASFGLVDLLGVALL
jgi:hypothetical protein